MRALVLLTVVMLLAGCAPNLIAGNEVGGVVGHAEGGVSTADQGAAAFSVAEAHCRQFGKVARVTDHNIWNSTMTFECVKP